MNLYQDVFFRSMDILRGRKTIRRLKFLRQSQFWDLDKLRHWQLARLNELLSQGKYFSPYYSEKLAELKLPLKSLSELDRLPILTKDDIRKNGEAIKCTNVPKERFVPSRTGGSTGEPMHYYWDKRGQDWNRASVYRSGEWAGVYLGEKTIQMSGSHFDYSQMQKFKWKLVYFLQRYKDMPVAYINDELLNTYYTMLQEYKPTSIWGYASGLLAFAEYIKDYQPDANFDYLNAIITSSENLSPTHRQTINSAFGANKVFDNYGSREMYIAAECNQHDGYHIHGEVLLVEVVDKDNKACRPGELGRIILTDLSNHAFPFIRYEIGDIGCMETDTICNCGIHLPRLRSINGRIADVVVLEDRILTAPNFATLFSDFKGIKSYQIIQNRKTELNVNIIPDSEYSKEVRKYIGNSLRELVGSNVKLVISEVDHIKVPESGKRRFVISTVSKNEL